MRLVVSIAFLCALCPASDAADDADWSQFRGPLGSASSDTAQAPLTWADNQNVVWKTVLPGRGASSPIVYDDFIFLTCFTGYGLNPDDPGERQDLRLHVLCFRRAGGEQLWDRSVPAHQEEQAVTRRVADHGYASNTPAADASGVYAFFGPTGVVAYSLEGEPKWQVNLGTGTAGFGSASSPVLYGDLLLVNASIESGKVVALNKHTGEEVWRIEGVERTWTTPLVAPTAAGDNELVINQKDVIRGFDPQTGALLWTCAGIDDYIVPTAITHDGIVYCLGGRTNRALAIRLGGRGDVTETHRLWLARIGANVTSPVYFEGRLYWSSDRGIATCLDATDGSEVFRSRLPTSDRVYASVIRVGNRLYSPTRENGVIVWQAGDTYTELAHNTLDSDESLINATMAISGNRLLLRTDRFLYCLGDHDAT